MHLLFFMNIFSYLFTLPILLPQSFHCHYRGWFILLFLSLLLMESLLVHAALLHFRLFQNHTFMIHFLFNFFLFILCFLWFHQSAFYTQLSIIITFFPLQIFSIFSLLLQLRPAFLINLPVSNFFYSVLMVIRVSLHR